uniref:Uncharacterized protein n=1 Tax=Minutocellus polymorphus TaxID=265543 RepID=A0A7S0AIR1_9STRA
MGDLKQIFELRANGGKSEELKIYSSGLSDQWYWVSVSYRQGERATASIFSQGQLDGSASIKLDSCASDESLSNMKLQIFAFASEDGSEANSTDISFVVIHQEILNDDSQYILQLGQQAQRYDKNS